MRNGWWWVVLVVGIVFIGGVAFTVGRLASMPKDSPIVKRDPPTKEERELQEIRIVTFEGNLVEATPGDRGWIVRFEQDAKKLELDGLLEQAHTFFRDLDRTGVTVSRSSYEVVTSALKDVWGNELKDVPVFRVELSGDVFDRINWEGFDPTNFERVAQDWWLHDEIKMKEQQRQQQQGQGGQGQSAGSGSSG